jgi:hypothetical protein
MSESDRLLLVNAQTENDVNRKVEFKRLFETTISPEVGTHELQAAGS